MRVILGLPNASKLAEKDSCNAMQGQEMEIREIPLSRNENQKWGGCILPIRQRTECVEGSSDDCSMQRLMFADEEGCQCEQHACQCSVVVEEKRHCCSTTSSQVEEGDCLLAHVRDHMGNLADTQGLVASPMDLIRESSYLTGMCSEDPLLSEECCGDTKEASKDHLEALSSSTPRCPSAVTSSPFLPSLTPNHLNLSLSSKPVGLSASTSQPIMNNHSTSSTCMTEHVPICKDEQNVSRYIEGTSPSSCEPAECFVIVDESDLEGLCQCSRTDSCLEQCAPPGPKGMSLISMTSFASLSSSDGPMCRICHEGPLSDEDMLAPCHCSGTLNYQHRKCLEQWLQTRGKDACELCDFHFKTERKGRPFSEWIRQPQRIRDRRNILTDCSCFTLLTPLVCVSTWLCLNGAYHYLNFYEGRGWEGIGLVALASVLIFIYLFWSLMSLRYHCIIWKTWRREHQRVHIIMETKDSQNSNNDDISMSSSKSSKLLSSCALSCSPSQKSSCAPSPKSPSSFSPSWTSRNSYSIPLQAPLASITSL